MTELRHEKSNVKLCMIQLRGLDTPQSNWNLNKMLQHPMPVATIFQPQLPAKGIVFLAEHPRRKQVDRISTAYTIRVSDWRQSWRTCTSAHEGERRADRQGPAPPGRKPRCPSAQDADQGAHGPLDDKAHTPAIRSPGSRCTVEPSSAASAPPWGSPPRWALVPERSVAAVVDCGGSGGASAAPIAVE